MRLLSLPLSFVISIGSAAPVSGRLDARMEYMALADLGSRATRSELMCQVVSDKPALGFDLRFHSEYHIALSMKTLAAAGGRLSMAMPVIPAGENEQPVYLARQVTIPNALPGNKVYAVLDGGFELGLGRYRVEWLMEDGRERVCSAHWDLAAKAPGGKHQLPLTLGPNRVLAMEGNYSSGRRQEQAFAPSIRVKILLNVSPAKPTQSIVNPEDAAVLFSMLRSIAGQPEIAVSSLVAFNLREQKVLYREYGGQMDFKALGGAMESSQSGTVDIGVLRDRESETHFVTNLLTDELGAKAGSPDAIIIIGPKVTLERRVPLEPLRANGSAVSPLFYLNYEPTPDEPWADTIGSAIKAYKGAAAYNILLPQDLAFAMRKLLMRIAKRPR